MSKELGEQAYHNLRSALKVIDKSNLGEQAYHNLCSALKVMDASNFDIATIMNLAAVRIRRYEEELADPEIDILVRKKREELEERLRDKGVISGPYLRRTKE